MFKVLARKIAITMGVQLQVNQDRIEIFAYGLELILGTLVQLMLLILLSLIIDTFLTTMICLIAFASLRYFGGGIHLSTYYRCLMVSVALLLALGKLATIDINYEALIVISILVILIGAVIIFKWVPAGTEKKQIKDEITRLRQRKKALLILFIWFFIILFLVIQKMNTNAFAAVLGILGSLLLITPWGYRGVKFLENLLNIILRGCKNV
ncbi:MAG: hypothetical protein FH756_16780 [Firmicutes bacterium]|nr:hypothetical protein [Bacillota bacterium]